MFTQRRLTFLTVATLLGASACGTSREADERTGQTRQAVISDGAHLGAVPGFAFLPPTVAPTTITGVFDPTLSPTVRIDETTATGATVRTLGTFTLATSGAETLRVDSNSYSMRWHTRRYDLSPGGKYRIYVLVGARELGFADVAVVPRRAAQPAPNPDYVVVEQDDQLTIRFHIARGALQPSDADADGVADLADNCPTVANADQRDTDGDRVGDACECANVRCGAGDQCHAAGVCNPQTGACSNAPRADGTACTDGNACTQLDTCQAGACVGASPVVCNAADPCHAAGTCDPGTGACSNPPAADGTGCSDGSACTQLDTCQAGACIGASPVVCNAADPCHAAGVCDPGTGSCTSPALPDGSGCDDRNVCTLGDACQAGVCTGGTTRSCSDGNACTADVCDPASGCVNRPVAEQTACVLPDATAACVSGTCSVVSCPSNRGDCDGVAANGCEVDLATSVGNCGACGTTCASGVCGLGSCVDTVIRVAVGAEHSCAVRHSGAVLCWGRNDAGQLGSNTTTSPQRVPVATVGIDDALEVAVGGAHTCAIRASGQVVCWGANTNGQLGDGTTAQRSVPVEAAGVTDAIHLAAGTAHTCAVRANGTLSCWGRNINSQLGDGTVTQRVTAVQVATATGPLTNVADVAAGAAHSCAVRASGEVYCWGLNANGQVGDGTTSTRNRPVQVVGLSGVVQVSAGGFVPAGGPSTIEHSCARLSSGESRCWGANTSGQLGNGTTVGSALPVAVATSAESSQIAAGGSHSCVVAANGGLACAGGNAQGQLGIGTTEDQSAPVTVTAVPDARMVATGANHTCVLRASGAVACWGANSAGQLGDGTTTASASPVTLRSLTCAPDAAPRAEACNAIDDDCDGAIDEGRTDLFAAPALADAWDPFGVGEAPTFALDGAWLRITDAGFASTPSTVAPDDSWIYDPDFDRGNQIVAPHAVGTGDFDLTFDFDFASSAAELTLAGVGLTNAADQLEVYAGIEDASNAGRGQPFARVRAAGTDPVWRGTIATSGTGSFHLVRTGSTVTVAFNGVTVLTTSSAADLQNLVVFTARHRDFANVAYAFGSFGLDRVALCY